MLIEFQAWYYTNSLPKNYSISSFMFKMKFNFVILLCAVFLWSKSVGGAAAQVKAGSRNASPKSYRRLLPSVENEEASTPLDIFLARDSARRNQIESIWNWDWWCQLQPKVGRGYREEVRYFYNAQLDQCFTFRFKGKIGNQNNFHSLVECERHCKGSAYMTLRDSNRAPICGLQPNAGMCLAMNYRYYYDVNADACKAFVYGGCGGNQNRFSTEEDCTRRCYKYDAK